jgi:hypothetical protein
VNEITPIQETAQVLLVNPMPDAIEAAFLFGTVQALRRQAGIQAERAAGGTTTPEGRPDVPIRTSEAALAASRSRQLMRIADELEPFAMAAEGRR